MGQAELYGMTGLRRDAGELPRDCGPVQSFREILAPVLGQCISIHGLAEEGLVIFLPHEEQVHLGNRNTVRVSLEQLEIVFHRDRPLLLDGEIKYTAAAEQEALQHVIALKLGGQFVAGSARLANHHDGGSNLKAISDVEFTFDKTRSREVLAEHSPRQIDSR